MGNPKDLSFVGEATRRLNPHLFEHEANARNQIPNAQFKQNSPPTLERATAREKASFQRAVVRFVGYRVRPLDPDNFAGSVKDLLDGLRHAAIISGDEPWRLKLVTEQVKVASFREEKTIVEIEEQ